MGDFHKLAKLKDRWGCKCHGWVPLVLTSTRTRVARVPIRMEKLTIPMAGKSVPWLPIPKGNQCSDLFCFPRVDLSLLKRHAHVSSKRDFLA